MELSITKKEANDAILITTDEYCALPNMAEESKWSIWALSKELPKNVKVNEGGKNKGYWKQEKVIYNCAWRVIKPL